MWGDLQVSFCLETSDPTFKFESRSWPDSPEAVGGFGLTLVQGDPSLTLTLFLPRHCWQSKPTLGAPGSRPQHPRFSRSPERRVCPRDQAAGAPWGSLGLRHFGRPWERGSQPAGAWSGINSRGIEGGGRKWVHTGAAPGAQFMASGHTTSQQKDSAMRIFLGG